jgi:hypothetical protein
MQCEVKDLFKNGCIKVVPQTNVKEREKAEQAIWLTANRL